MGTISCAVRMVRTQNLLKCVCILGLGDNDEVLDSAEFFDVGTKRWTVTSALKQGRTEHVMSLVYGIPTVIGGTY